MSDPPYEKKNKRSRTLYFLFFFAGGSTLPEKRILVCLTLPRKKQFGMSDPSFKKTIWNVWPFLDKWKFCMSDPSSKKVYFCDFVEKCFFGRKTPTFVVGAGFSRPNPSQPAQQHFPFLAANKKRCSKAVSFQVFVLQWPSGEGVVFPGKKVCPSRSSSVSPTFPVLISFFWACWAKIAEQNKRKCWQHLF